MEEIHDDLINRKYSTLIADGFRIYRKNFRNLVLTWFIFILLYNLLYFILIDIIGDLFNTRVLYLIYKYIITGIIGLIGLIRVCSVSTFLFKDYTLVDTEFMEEFRKSINYRLKYPIFISVILFILFEVILYSIQDFIFEFVFYSGWLFPLRVFILWTTSLSFAFLSIILSTFYIFVRYTYNIIDIERPIYEARLLTKGFFWKIVGVLVIDMIIQLIISGVFFYSYNYIITTFFFDIYIESLMTRNYVLIFLNRIIYDIPAILIGPLSVCLITPLFAHQYLKRENKMLEEKI
ncbi:MAG: hypothetical protein ACFFCV_11425 [Promethearchaeota archaeon]